MEVFLAENNACGQTLLKLVSKGNRIIAELLRLKDIIPSFFKPCGTDEIAKWENVIYDFTYFTHRDAYDELTKKNPTKKELFDEIADNHFDLISRFYKAFKDIHKFVSAINSYVDDLEEGVYIQKNLDFVSRIEDGRQLLCEAVYLYGVMLLVLDLHIPGNVREKILVSYERCLSYYRCSGKQEEEKESNCCPIVCQMLRSTGHSATNRPLKYPESYFSRIAPRKKLVDLVIDVLRSEDIYHQINAYPSHDHRTTALASQAAMLFVCLFFKPDWLDSENSKMRNIVDKYFPDNWIISIYMGITVNLIDAWDPYKAAKTALANTTNSDNIKQLISTHDVVISKVLQDYKAEASLNRPITEEKISSYLKKKMVLITKLNVTIKWVMLHTNLNHQLFVAGRQSISIRNQVVSNTNFSEESLLELLLTTSELELKVKDMFKKLLYNKQNDWNRNNRDAYERAVELKDLLSVNNSIGRGRKNESLSSWFAKLAELIDSLDYEKLVESTEKVIELIEALKGVQGHVDALDSSHLTNNTKELREVMKLMVRGSSVKEKDLINLQIVGDISYGWLLVNRLSGRIQARIERVPENVAGLRALFLKLASVMEIPLLRINQAKSQDLISVSQLYSDELVAYVRKVLHIIPQKMFELMLSIMQVKENAENDDFRETKPSDIQLQLAELTQRVAKLADGILQMQSTLVGVIEIDPKTMLEDGIRNELVTKLSTSFESNIQFPKKSKPGDITEKLNNLSVQINQLMKSLEYIQDHLDICGLKIFQEEVSRVLGFNMDMESNQYLKEKVLPWQSTYQSKAIPIQIGICPTPKDEHITFMGRLLHQLLLVTDYRTMTYYPPAMSWFEKKKSNAQAIVSLQLFDCMSNAIGSPGIARLDELISYKICIELQQLVNELQEERTNWLDFLANHSTDLSKIIDKPAQHYSSLFSRTHLVKLFDKMRHFICLIGQLQLIRKHLSIDLKTGCKFNAKNYYKALSNLNCALIEDTKQNQEESEELKDYLSEISTLLNWAGLSNPYAKIYITSKSPQFLGLLTALYTLLEISHMRYNKDFGIFEGIKTENHVDSHSLLLGVHTLLHQFHPECWNQFALYVAQYVKSHAATCDMTKVGFYPPAVSQPIYFMRKLISVAGLPRTMISEKIPNVVLDLISYYTPL